jgi:hypothetical protein
VNARLIAPTPLRLGALLSDDLRQRSDLAAEIRRGMGKREAYRLMRRLPAKELEERMPDDGDQSALADEGRLDGPRIVVLVDDYDLLTTAGQPGSAT